jgi:hypothetical protein
MSSSYSRSRRAQRRKKRIIIAATSIGAAAAAITGITVAAVAGVEGSNRAESMLPVPIQMTHQTSNFVYNNMNNLNPDTLSQPLTYNPQTLTGTFSIFNNGGDRQYSLTTQCQHLPASQRGIGATAGAVKCAVTGLKQVGP